MSELSANSLGSPTPVFRVEDVDASIAYYTNALGFELRWRASKGFACVAQGKCALFLTDDNQSQPRMGSGPASKTSAPSTKSTSRPAQRFATRPTTSSGRSRCRSKTSTETSCASAPNPSRISP
jgi:hypothetical protein